MGFLLCLACLGAPSAAAQTLEYYSDYLSFVGEDAQGNVAFALANNRGRDGEHFQAEHFAVMYDEHGGWLTLRGSGRYPNPSGALSTIPDSAYFAFSGMRITSGGNALALEIEPIRKIVVRTKDGASYWLGSAGATLRWSGRSIPGRVIYEYLYRPEWNRLARHLPGRMA